MTCDEIRPLLATRRHLSFTQERAAQTHLASCARCAALWLREERIMQRVRALPIPDKDVPEHTRYAIRSALAMQRPAWHRPIGAALLAGAVLVFFTLLVYPTIRHTLSQTAGAGGSQLSAPVGIVSLSTPVSETLYIASSVTSGNAQDVVGARVTAVDLSAGQERYRIAGGDEAARSPDGSRLYVAGTLTGRMSDDVVRAIDAQTGRELWHTPIQHRAGYPGQSNLVVSPDGRWLYVRSYDVTRGSGDASTVPFWMQIIDTATGHLLPTTIALPSISLCGAPTLASPPIGHVVYVSCYGSNILTINTLTQRIEPLLPTQVIGAVVPIGLHELYVVNTGLDIFVLDNIQRTVLRKVSAHPKTAFSASHDLIALSGDGMLLVAGQTIQGQSGTDTACEIRVFDTRTGEERGRFRYEQPLHTFVVDSTGQTLYAVRAIGLREPDDTVIAFALPSGNVRAERKRPQEAITHMFVDQ